MSKPMAVLRECGITPLASDPYGRLKCGYIKLRSYWISSSHWQGDLGSLFLVNGYGENSKSYIRDSRIEYKVLGDEDVICTFNELPNFQNIRDVFRGVSLLQIGYWNGWKNRTSRMVLIAMMLKDAGSDGCSVRVGIAEFPSPKHAHFETAFICPGPPSDADVDAMYKDFEDNFDKIITEECQYRNPKRFDMDSWEMRDVTIV